MQMERITACLDCMHRAAFGQLDDMTEMDDPQYCADHAEAYAHGVEAWKRALGSPLFVTTGDPERDSDFSAVPCAICDTGLAGSRHELILYT